MSSRGEFVPQSYGHRGEVSFTGSPMEPSAPSDDADVQSSTMPLKIDGAHVHGAGAMSSGSLNISSASTVGAGTAARSSHDHTDREIDAAVAIVSGWGAPITIQDSTDAFGELSSGLSKSTGPKIVRRPASKSTTAVLKDGDESRLYYDDGKMMMPPAYAFPSDRRADGASPPGTTLRLTIDHGIIKPNEASKMRAVPLPEAAEPGPSASKSEGPGAAEDEASPVELPPALASASEESNSSSPDSRLLASAPVSAGDQLAPSSRYPYPEIRPLYTATKPAPLASTAPTYAGFADAQDDMDDSHYEGMVFGLPTVSELSQQGLGGMIHATEQGWGHNPSVVRRPPFVGPPSAVPPRPMSVSAYNYDYDYDVDSSVMNPPIARRAPRYEAPPLYHGHGGQPSAHDLDASYGQMSRSGRSDGGASRLFSLLNVCEELIEQIEREDRRKAREIWRYKTDVWGKALMPVKKKHINDARYYDSEDSDYEAAPGITDEAAMARMLDIDALCKRSTARNFPKHHATAWKTIRKTKPRRGMAMAARFHPTPGSAYLGDSDDGAPGRQPARRKVVWKEEYVYQHHKAMPKAKKKTTLRMPGVFEPKRNSTALHESYIREADGTLTCVRCGKGGFVATLGLRSHLSHCPGTRKAKEERKRLLAIYVALGGDAAKFDGKEEERFRGLEADGKLPALPAAGPAMAVAKPPDTASPALVGLTDNGSGHMFPDTRMPHQANPGHMAQGYDSDGYMGMGMGLGLGLGGGMGMGEELGVPLVPHEVRDGEALVHHVVSYRVPETGRWEDVTLTRYRGRNNSHQFALRDGRITWSTLTSHNCRLERGYRGARPPMSMPADNEPAPRLRDMGGGGGSSGADSDDNSGSSSRRRSARNGDNMMASGELDGVKGIGLNVFYQEQEKLISRKGKRKAGHDSTNGSAANSDAEDGDMKVRIRTEVERDNMGAMRPKMRMSSIDMSNRYSLMGGGMPYTHTVHHKAPPRHVQASGRGRYGMASGMGGQSMGNDHGPNGEGQFSCRRCRGVFSNKQRLGWHTRRNECPGTPPLAPAPSSLAPPALQLLASTSMHEQDMHASSYSPPGGLPTSGPSGTGEEFSAMDVDGPSAVVQERPVHDMSERGVQDEEDERYTKRPRSA